MDDLPGSYVNCGPQAGLPVAYHELGLVDGDDRHAPPLHGRDVLAQPSVPLSDASWEAGEKRGTNSLAILRERPKWYE